MDLQKSLSGPLARLHLADPDSHAWLLHQLKAYDPPLPEATLTRWVDAIIWALSLDTRLARTMSDTILQWIVKTGGDSLAVYIRLVQEASATGPTLANIMAEHLGPVLGCAPHLLKKFQNLTAIMLAKGTYTLNTPLVLLSRLLSNEDIAGAESYMELLSEVFIKPMSYNLCLRWVYQIPKAVQEFPAQRRAAQLAEFRRIVHVEMALIDSFLDGMQRGLDLLSERSLKQFVDSALARYMHNPTAGVSFLSLASKIGRDRCLELQIAAPLTMVMRQLNRYLSARLGHPISVKPLSAINSVQPSSGAWICSDGQHIYATEEIRHFECLDQNKALYLTLIRLEACFFEFGSFSFDLERAARYPAADRWLKSHVGGATTAKSCEARYLFDSFDQPGLAEDIFMILEFARLARLAKRLYPGLMRQIGPPLAEEHRRLHHGGDGNHPLADAYQCLVLDQMTEHADRHNTTFVAAHLEQGVSDCVSEQSPVEVCASILCQVYETIESAVMEGQPTYQPLMFPFGIRLNWHAIADARKPYAAQAENIVRKLAEMGMSVYSSDLTHGLLTHQGRLSGIDIKRLVLARARNDSQSSNRINVSEDEFEQLMNTGDIAPTPGEQGPGNAFFYPEWDFQIQDYLQNHTRVQETTATAIGANAFYQKALTSHGGLVAHMRRAFEWLRPEATTILRQWPDGDAFDYQALLDYIVDRRVGRIPSDRLYIKRLKMDRDVAVLLLVDLSRSTANSVIGRQCSVLDLTKEAMVLFCEALEVVGDNYALAGFSGTGRHSVDYFTIKEFEESLGPTIQDRISTLSPQRSTRLGAAIRHATVRLAAFPARVRLMLIISDGFPNDLGYKADYAIADTRKAVQEARSKTLHVKAVTVNIGRDPKLDDLYGRMHSHVIENVNALPGKLLHLYSSLTRH